MNRLASATSPYLLQHANPVEWWPWSEEAFEEARRRDVPVLISVGYAACHWWRTLDQHRPRSGAHQSCECRFHELAADLRCTLATAAPGSGLGTTRLGADLRLACLTETTPGTYRAVLTLTAI